MNVNRLDLVGGQLVLLHQPAHGIGRCLDGRADAELLDIRGHDLVVGPQAVDPLGQLVPALAEDFEEIVLAREDVLFAREPVLHEQDRSDAVAGPHAGKHKGLLHMLPVPDPGGDPRGLLPRVGQGITDLPGVELRQAGRRRGGAEEGADGMGGVAFLLRYRAVHDPGDAGGDIVAQDHGAEERLPGGILPSRPWPGPPGRWRIPGG